MTSTDLVSTRSIPHEKMKVFVFNRYNVNDPEKQARIFCRDNHMKFLRMLTFKPYEYHTWQHYETVGFEVECTLQTPMLFYPFGKL
jgi:hypothetical protein